MMKKIAIISKNKTASKLAELEAEACGASADVFVEIPKATSEYSIILLDSDTVGNVPAEGGYLLAGFGENSEDRKKYDVFLEYPFLLDELRGLFQRGNRVEQSKASDETSLTVYANGDRKSVKILGKTVQLSEYEFRVLEILCMSSGNAVSREELSQALDADHTGNMADVYVCHLRKKFDKLFDKKIIYTVRGVGYKTYFSMK